jgi:polysaccharide biosynthesis protein PelA
MNHFFIRIVKLNLFILFGISSIFTKLNAEDLIPRSVLALIESDTEQELIHRNIEMPLNYYGIKVIYKEHSKAFAQELPPLLAALIWPSEESSTEVSLIHNNLKELHKRKVKLIFLEHLPGTINRKSGLSVPLKTLNEIYNPFGIQIDKGFLKNPLVHNIDKINERLINFERNFEFKGHNLPIIKSLHKKSDVYLSVAHKFLKEKRSDLVVIGDTLCYALKPAVVVEDPATYLRKWILNPFEFVEKALDLKNRPIPDVSTINGYRSIYCHIDGDAFNGICRFDKKRNCARVVYEDVLLKHIYPTTLSLVHSWFDPDVKEVSMISVIKGKQIEGDPIRITATDQKKWIELAVDIFSQPWVENALHGYGHPLKWQKRVLAIKPKGRPFSLKDEFEKSLEIFTELISESSSDIFLWTGDCFPGDDALAYLSKLKIRNMNGGDTLYDKSYDSYTSVAPYYRSVGPYYQIYTSASNENIYTNEWAGPFSGFRNVIKTFERTETPRRTCPVNIYYHWYSGERKASLNALKNVYEWADSQTLTPIFAGHYIDIVHGFISTDIIRDKNTWLIKNNHALKTIRFENEIRNPVVNKKNNILGYCRNKGRLYIHLGPNKESKIEFLKEKTKQPMLKKANAMIKDINFLAHGVVIDLWSIRDIKITLSHLDKKIVEEKNIKISYIKDDVIISIGPQKDKRILLKWMEKD